MKKIFRTAQFLSYIATIVIAILLSIFGFKQFFYDKPAETAVTNSTRQPAAQVSPVGKSVPLEQVNWKENKKTLVLYLSTECKYCRESNPFYQRLAKESIGKKDVKLIAVLTQPVEQATEYLKNNSVDIPQVYSAQLWSLGIRGTPSILLVDENGVVSDYWRGKLTIEKEHEVLNKLSS